MAIIDYFNPDPERGIFGCGHAANEYGKVRNKLPELDRAIASLSQDVDRLLTEASGIYYTSLYGPTDVFRASARSSIEDLEKANRRITQFVTDMRENFLRESEPVANPLSFFLSYSHKDRTFADRLVKDLRAKGHTVWRDDDNVKIGESIRRSIEEGITSSRFTIVLVSNSSVQSEWCQKELDMALLDEATRDVKVLPIVIDDCEIPRVIQSKRYLVMKNYKRDLQKFLSLLPGESVSREHA